MTDSVVVLAQGDFELPALGPRIASIVVSVGIIVLLTWYIQKHLGSTVTHGQRIARTVAQALVAFVGVFGIVGPAVAVRYVADLQHALARLLAGASQAVSQAADQPSGWRTLYLIGIIVLAGFGLYVYWKYRTLAALLVLMVACLPLMAYPDFQGLSWWYVAHVGAPIYAGLKAFFHAL